MVAEDESERKDLFYAALMNLRCRALVGVSCDIFDCFVVREAQGLQTSKVLKAESVRNNLTFTANKK